MTLSDDVLCLFTGTVRKQDGSYCIEIPEQEVSLGEIEQDGVYRVALLSSGETGKGEQTRTSTQSQEAPSPPVAEGDQRTVDIEDIGDQGDGIARVERGYVVIVPDTELGERVTIEITDVRENLGFGVDTPNAPTGALTATSPHWIGSSRENRQVAAWQTRTRGGSITPPGES